MYFLYPRGVTGNYPCTDRSDHSDTLRSAPLHANVGATCRWMNRGEACVASRAESKTRARRVLEALNGPSYLSGRCATHHLPPQRYIPLNIRTLCEFVDLCFYLCLPAACDDFGKLTLKSGAIRPLHQTIARRERNGGGTVMSRHFVNERCMVGRMRRVALHKKTIITVGNQSC